MSRGEVPFNAADSSLCVFVSLVKMWSKAKRDKERERKISGHSSPLTTSAVCVWGRERERERVQMSPKTKKCDDHDRKQDQHNCHSNFHWFPFFFFFFFFFFLFLLLRLLSLSLQSSFFCYLCFSQVHEFMSWFIDSPAVESISWASVSLSLSPSSFGVRSLFASHLFSGSTRFTVASYFTSLQQRNGKQEENAMQLHQREEARDGTK